MRKIKGGPVLPDWIMVTMLVIGLGFLAYNGFMILVSVVEAFK
tara:strand:- start:566 stop:694 length:129 start_codon:yes stop_codon:yes gene_type:complete